MVSALLLAKDMLVLTITLLDFRSILLFTASILCFMWRVSYKALDSVTSSPVPDILELISRIAICLLLGIGILYGIRVVIEFRHYGKAMDDKWRDRVDEYVCTHAPMIKTAGSQDFLRQGYMQPTTENGTAGTHTQALAALLAPSQSFVTLPTSSMIKGAYESRLCRTVHERQSLPSLYKEIGINDGDDVSYRRKVISKCLNT